MDTTESCPRCKTTKYRNPSMKLYINLCGHPLCGTCVEQVYFRGSAECPQCKRTLKKIDFREQIFEDSYIEKENQIRRKILKDFTETESDFPTLKEFNDYLEKIETFIFNLANNYDEENTVKSMEELKKELKSKSRTKKVELKSKTAVQYVYKPFIMDINGPKLPSADTLRDSYVQHLIPIVFPYYAATGFQPRIPVQRALQEAFTGLYISTKK